VVGANKRRLLGAVAVIAHGIAGNADDRCHKRAVLMVASFVAVALNADDRCHKPAVVIMDVHGITFNADNLFSEFAVAVMDEYAARQLVAGNGCYFLVAGNGENLFHKRADAAEMVAWDVVAERVVAVRIRTVVRAAGAFTQRIEAANNRNANAEMVARDDVAGNFGNRFNKRAAAVVEAVNAFNEAAGGVMVEEAARQCVAVNGVFRFHKRAAAEMVAYEVAGDFVLRFHIRALSVVAGHRAVAGDFRGRCYERAVSVVAHEVASDSVGAGAFGGGGFFAKANNCQDQCQDRDDCNDEMFHALTQPFLVIKFTSVDAANIISHAP